MNKANSIFTRSWTGLDRGVWMTLLITVISSAIFLGFKMTTQVDCMPFEINAKGISELKRDTFYANIPITFTAKNTHGQDIVWDFADGSLFSTGDSATHYFNHAGTYTVKAIANETDQCITTKIISIVQPKAEDINIAAIPTDVIKGPDMVNVGETVKYFSIVKADSYKWEIKFLQLPVQTESFSVYTFKTDGPQTISLTLNGDDKQRFTKEITVKPVKRFQPKEDIYPVEVNKPTPKTNPTVSNEVLKPLLPEITSFDPQQGVAGETVMIFGKNFDLASDVSFGEMKAKSFDVKSSTTIIATVGQGKTGSISITTPNGTKTSASPFKYITIIGGAGEGFFLAQFDQVLNAKADAQSFNQYLCDREATKVQANKTTMTLNDFCNLIHGHPNIIRINRIQFERNPRKPICITKLIIDYEKKGLIGWKHPD